MKKRADLVILEKKLSESREKAKELIKLGAVFVSGKKIRAPSQMIDFDSNIEIRGIRIYVGRAGYKLEKALGKFKIDISGKVCLDIGSSTGGFVDCLLQKGAKRVYAVEIAKEQLHPDLIKDKRVVNLEGTNVKEEFDLGEKVEICTIDVTFAGLNEVLTVIKTHLGENAEVIALFKPPFEFGKREKGKKMAIRKISEVKKSLGNLISWCDNNGFRFRNLVESPIRGKGAKQKEFLIHLTFQGRV